MARLADLPFDNTYARLPDVFHQRIEPTPVPDPYLVAFNPAAARLIDLDPAEANNPDFVQYFAGNKRLPGSEPVAMKYAGHQFGTYVPQLGDGRAILLGEVRNAAGERWDLHLKGAGEDRVLPVRRRPGGAAVEHPRVPLLRGDARARHPDHAGPVRDRHRPGSVPRGGRDRGPDRAAWPRATSGSGRSRCSPTAGRRTRCKVLADYVIEQHYPHLRDADDRYVRVPARGGGPHGPAGGKVAGGRVRPRGANTDNMSIARASPSITGPYGFMEEFDPGFVCNHSDETGRYAFDQQPRIGYWNLAALGPALLSLMEIDHAKAALNTYADEFNTHMHELMTAKLGLTTHQEGDPELWTGLLDMLARYAGRLHELLPQARDVRHAPGESNDQLRGSSEVRTVRRLGRTLPGALAGRGEHSTASAKREWTG